MIAKPFFFIGVFFLTTSVFSQQVTDLTDELPWRPAPVMSSANMGGQNGACTSFEQAILHIDEKSTILPVYYPKNKNAAWGLVLLDNNAVVKWETPVRGCVLSLCRMGDQVMVFYTPDRNEPESNKNIQKIFAVNIQIENGIAGNEKLVFENTTKQFIDPKVKADPEQQRCYLLVRFSKGTQLVFSPRYRDIQSTTDMQLVTISKDLEIQKSHPVKSKAVGGVFLAFEAMKDGSLVIISRNGESITAEKINVADAAIREQLNTPAEVSNDVYNAPCLYYNPEEPDNLYLAFRCKKSKKEYDLRLYNIDWQAKKIAASVISLNNDYVELLKEQNEGTSSLRKSMDDLFPVILTRSGDRFAIISQVMQVHIDPRQNYAKVYFNEIVVTVFDKQLKNVGNIVIEKKYHIFYSDVVLPGAYAAGNKLHVVYNIDKGPVGAAAEYAQVDLIRAKLLKKEKIERGKLPGNSQVEAGAILWRQGAALLPYYLIKGLNLQKWTSLMQKTTY